MQSSPPTRVWRRGDSQPDSEYSLDLAALDLDGPDDTDTDARIPEPRVDHVLSEDIDGPSDFTQNMDLWMRGGSMNRGGTLNQKNFSSATRKDEAEFEREREREGSHTPARSPPQLSVRGKSQYEEGFSSEWQTDGEASPPLPPNHKQFLQPTVEDYYSELSPARQHLQQSVRGRSLHSNTYASQKHSPAKDGSRSLGRASSPTLSPVRSPMLQRTSPPVSEHSRDGRSELQESVLRRTSTNGTYSQKVDNESRLELEEQFQQLDAKCAQLEHLNEALAHALDEERRARKQEKTSHESQTAEAARREQDLIEMKELAHRHNADFRREFGQLKEQLLNQQKLTDLARSGENGKQESHDAEIDQLRTQIQTQQTEHERQSKAFEQDLAAVRRGRDQAEKAASDLREELEAERDHHEAERQRFRTELQQAHDDEDAISELERELLQCKSEIENHKSAKIDADDQMKTLREQLTAARQTHEDDVTRTSNERSRAVELAAGLQRQMQELKQQLKDEQTAHEAELARTRSHGQTSSNTSSQEVEVLRRELESKQSELDTIVLERNSAKDIITALTADLTSSRKQLADLESVNASLDMKVTEAIRKREKHWQRKLDESNKERELMARTLMHQWGRQEAGVDTPQMYAYKYGKEKETGDEKENAKPRAPSSSRG